MPTCRGDRTEAEAIRWLTDQGLRIIAHRFETPFAEIDILALRASGEIVLYEVKSSFWPDDRALGLGFRQKKRLEKSAYWVSCESGRAVDILLLGPSTRGGQFLEIPIF